MEKTTLNNSMKCFPLKKISVIIPCFCVDKYIQRCIESILHQSISKKMLEIILIDDASTDQTKQILQAYEKKYTNQIILILLNENKGQGYARNIGLQYASGDYIVFVDSDDYLKENALQKMYSEIENTNADIVAAGYTVFDDAGHYKQNLLESCTYHLDRNDQLSSYLLKYGCQNNIWGKLYKHDLFSKNNILFPENIKMEDIAFYEDSLFHAHIIHLISESLYFYYQNPNGTMFSSAIKNYFIDTFYVQRDICTKFLQDSKLNARLNADNGLLQAFEMVYYVKGVLEPIQYMIDAPALWKDELVYLICSTAKMFFPDIDKNNYILHDSTDLNIAVLKLFKSLK